MRPKRFSLPLLKCYKMKAKQRGLGNGESGENRWAREAIGEEAGIMKYCTYHEVDAASLT